MSNTSPQTVCVCAVCLFVVHSSVHHLPHAMLLMAFPCFSFQQQPIYPFLSFVPFPARQLIGLWRCCSSSSSSGFEPIWSRLDCAQKTAAAQQSRPPLPLTQQRTSSQLFSLNHFIKTTTTTAGDGRSRIAEWPDDALLLMSQPTDGTIQPTIHPNRFGHNV